MRKAEEGGRRWKVQPLRRAQVEDEEGEEGSG